MKYVNSIAITAGDAVFVDFGCVVNNVVTHTERLAMNMDTLRMVHSQIGLALESLDARAAEVRRAN